MTGISVNQIMSGKIVPILRCHAPPSWIECRTKTRLDGHAVIWRVALHGVWVEITRKYGSRSLLCKLLYEWQTKRKWSEFVVFQLSWKFFTEIEVDCRDKARWRDAFSGECRVVTTASGNSWFRYLSSSLHVLYRITEFATYHNRVRYQTLTLLTSKRHKWRRQAYLIHSINFTTFKV